MVGDERESDDSNDLPLDDSVYISKEEDTMEKMKRGLKKFGKDIKKGAEDIADSSKKFATKSKEKMDVAREERKKAKAMKNPLKFPWSTLSVVELKDNLKGLGLKVSGKKDDLIERIMEHYRTEIPEMEDGTPHLIEDLEPIEENPPAPDIDELIKEEDEVVEELTPTFEVVDPETPAIQFVGSEQLYVPDPIIKNQKRTKTVQNNNWRARKIVSSVNLIFGGLIFLLMLSVSDYGLGTNFFGSDGNPINWFIHSFGTRLLRPYGGINDLEVRVLAGMLSIMLFMSSMLFFTRKHSKTAALMVNLVLIISLGVRISAGIISDSFEMIGNEWGYVIVDLMFIIPFSFTCWVPAMVVSEISYSRQSSPESFQVSDDPLFSDETPQSITDATSDGQLGEDMSRFNVERPQPPKRRRIGQGSMYESIFLFLSLAVFWPATIGMTLIIGGIPTRLGPLTIEEHGLIMLGPLYAASIFCSYIVYSIDKEARSGEIYAKEKLAYHRDMDQYLELKRVYYESEAARVSGNNGDK